MAQPPVTKPNRAVRRGGALRHEEQSITISTEYVSEYREIVRLRLRKLLKVIEAEFEEFQTGLSS